MKFGQKCMKKYGIRDLFPKLEMVFFGVTHLYINLE